ncbi:uncharacterized protein LOC122565142 isoform X2 [Chiloscyllium plagiosum]|uniref:uncharacterized protein LOC122565142 isoform X2 n=1 Tax=Chiloscyllium plagiosum TaxID=36176 RepID=UPI001CB7C607|nr:uncharacterized protein LOC122565142 isoform X2 [Chiloscyllium plagiosum]
MAADSQVPLHHLTHSSVVDFRGERRKGNLHPDNDATRQLEQLEEKERGNPDEITATPEILDSKIPKRVEKGHMVVGEEAEDCREQNFKEQHETNILSGPASVVGEKGTTAEGSGEVHCSVPVETPSEDLQLLAQYMIITDTYLDEDHSLAELQVEDMITLDMDNDVQLDAPKMDSARLMKENAGIKKMFMTGNTSEMRELNFDSTEKGQYPRTEQSSGETVKDEGFGKADENDVSIVVDCEPNKSSIKDSKHANNEINPLKGLSDNHGTSDDMDKNLLDESEPKYKRSAEEKVRNVTGSNPGCKSKAENDCEQPRDRPSVRGKSDTETNIRGDSMKQENDVNRKYRHREKDGYKRRSSRSRTRSSERKRIGRGRSRSSERGRSRWSSERRSRSAERRRKSRSSERGRSHWSSERRQRSRSSERQRSKERRRTSRSRSRHRSSPSKKRDSSIEKTHELKEQPWRLDPKEALWAVERRREREIWEEEARELLERDLDRLQLERMCLERGRLDESFPIRQRLLLREEAKQIQERTYRQRPHGAWERETRQEWEGRELLRRELDQVRYKRLRLDRKTLEPETQERLRFLDGEGGKEQERNFRERECLHSNMYYEETLKRPDIGYCRGLSGDPSWKMEGFPDLSSQGKLGTGLTSGTAVQRSLKGLYRMELAEAQRTDPSLEAVRYQAMHPTSKTNNDLGGTFLYKDGILIRRWSPKEGFFKGSEIFEEVVVPEIYRGEILKVAHNIPCSEHQGIKHTGRRMLQYFYWPSVFIDVAHHCKACEKCRYSHKRGDAGNLGLRPLPTINIPFKRVSIDVVGPLPFTTNSGKRYILMMVDCASRYPDATALVSVEADIVAMALLVMFTRVGFPDEILSNQGENFMSQLVMQLKRQCQEKQLRSNSYYPQVNELVEKFNGTLKQILRTYAEQNPCDWDEKLQYLLFACREMPQDLTGFSPFELLYGRRVYGTLLLIKEAWLGKCFGTDKYIVEHVLNARDALLDLIENIPEDRKQSIYGRNLWYCHNAGTRAYDVGERVLVLQPVKRQKTQLHWEGPYTVVEPGKYVYYTVEIPFNKFRIYHVNMMKPYLDS